MTNPIRKEAEELSKKQTYKSIQHYSGDPILPTYEEFMNDYVTEWNEVFLAKYLKDIDKNNIQIQNYEEFKNLIKDDTNSIKYLYISDDTKTKIFFSSYY